MARLISFCGSVGANTGGIDCDARFGNFRMVFLGGAKFTPAEYATEAALKTAILNRINRANGDSEKLYPFPVANTVANNTEANTEETLGDGTRRTLREGRPAYTLEAGFVGLNQESSMMAFNNATIPAFAFDDTGKFIGKFDADDNLVGAKVQVFTSPAGMGIYSAGTTTKTSINYLNSRDLSTNAKFFQTEFDTDDFEGLLDAEVRALAAPTGNAHKLGVFIPNKSIGKDKNLYDEYDDELNATGMWRGWTAAGAQVAPTTVVKDTALLGWTVTFGTAVVRVDLATPQVLLAGDVKGIEGIALTI